MPSKNVSNQLAWVGVFTLAENAAASAIDYDELWIVEVCISDTEFGAGFHESIFAEIKRSEEHTSELQSQSNLVCRLLLETTKGRECLADISAIVLKWSRDDTYS